MPWRPPPSSRHRTGVRRATTGPRQRRAQLERDSTAMAGTPISLQRVAHARESYRRPLRRATTSAGLPVPHAGTELHHWTQPWTFPRSAPNRGPQLSTPRPLPRGVVRSPVARTATPPHRTRLDTRQAMVDPLQQIRLLRARRDLQTHEVIGQADVRKYPAGVVMKMQKRPRLQIEDARTWFAQHGARAQLFEQRQHARQRRRAGVLHCLAMARVSCRGPSALRLDCATRLTCGGAQRV